MTRLAIIDSGGANIASLQCAIERLGAPAILTVDAQVLRQATHVILPGVGTAADCMGRLHQAGLVETIRALSQPLLGICAGMQLLFESSEEGDTACLGLLPGRVRRLIGRTDLPVPHMGWNQLEFTQSGTRNPLLQGLHDGAHMYFVHSYAAPPGPAMLAQTIYGQPFAALVQHANIQGTQFHPERSGRDGALLLENFLHL